ncbi:MAG: FecR domain-containing protein [Cyclobacteriaceae bacterium]|nr:FecR domain-containing protein [Cyclobacteriaceae bacterium]
MGLLPNDMDDVIGKVLAGEASVQEQQRLNAWIGASEANRAYYESLKTIFEKAASSDVNVTFDTDAAWNKLKARIEDEKTVSLQQRTYTTTIWVRIAAGVAIFFGVVYFLNNPISTTQQPKALISTTMPVQDTLPDGSTAYLNKASELIYHYDTKTKSRKVKLKGEAYFSVKHDEAKPFLIEADDIRVRDIGTEFNLKAYPEKDTIEILVTEGEVQFYTLYDSGLYLKAGQRAIYSKRNKIFQRIEKPDTNILAYKTKVFSFNNTDLKSVVALLNEVYNVKIVLANKKLFDCRLTANYKEDDPAIIAEVIAETMNLTLIRKGEELILDGDGCASSQ